MQHAVSADGTRIAYSTLGQGPTVVLVDGALCRRGFGPAKPLAEKLQDRFRVVFYDRRGRGDSEPGPGCDVDREVQDLQAVIAAVGGDVFLYGTSSGAMLAARAVAAGTEVKKLVLHEPPLALDGTHVPQPPDLPARIDQAIAEDRRGDAVALFMKSVGVPAFGRFMMKLIPGVWSGLTPSAHTLPHDFALLGDTQRGGPLPEDLVESFRRIDVPTRLMVGGKSPPWMHHTVKRLAEEIAHSDVVELAKQQHNVSPQAMAPALACFFA